MRCALTVFALVSVAAARCNNDNCLRAVIASAFTTRHGAQDCSSYLAVTVTPETSTVTSTVSLNPTAYTTEVETDLFTTSQTTTVTTETQSYTTQTTVTASTQTNVVTTTVAANAGPAKRTVPASSAFPAYASACSSFEKYVSACSRVGVLPTTVTAEAPVTTVVVTQTSTITSFILSTTSTTETAIVSVTASTATTEIQTLSVTETALVTVTATPAPTCTGHTGAFRAVATQYNSQSLYIYANMVNGLSGGVTWQQGSTSTSTTVQNKYLLAIDAQGHLYLAYNIPPYSYTYYFYVSTASSGSLWPQVNTQQAIANSIANGGQVAYVNACVNTATNQLQLEAAGRTQMLYCGAQLWMSNTLGSDINRGGCTQMFPTLTNPFTQ